MAEDWDASDRKLRMASVAAIKRFSSEHPETEVRCFYFDCDEPRYGHLYISIDTAANNLRFTSERQRSAIARRRKNLRGKLTWQWAKYQLSTPALSPFNTNSGDFAFREFAEVTFPAWAKLARTGAYPKGAEPEDDYLESNVRLVLWRVAEQLVRDDSFGPLQLASPFIVGYSIHDQEEVVLRLLNWPGESRRPGVPRA